MFSVVSLSLSLSDLITSTRTHTLPYLQGIGEGAVVLGQLLGYDDAAERLAVLDAGLAVRGPDFAREMAALTAEALEGFKAVDAAASGDGVDPALVRSVEAMDAKIRSFVAAKGEAFQ